MAQNAQPLRVALAGAGMITHYHLTAWSRQADVAVVAIADPVAERAKARAAEFGIPAVYADVPSMLAAEKPDALDIATPRETHAAVAMEAADAGIPVLCQKPMAPTLAEAEALVRAMEGRVRFMVHENWRFQPYYRQIKSWLDSGTVGPASLVKMSTLRAGLIPDATGRVPSLERSAYFATETRLIIAEVMIHHLDVLRWLVGPLKVVAARAARLSDRVVGEDMAAIVMETPDGMPVLLDGHLTAPGFPERPYDRLDLIGQQASIRLAEGWVLERLGSAPERIAYDRAEAYQAGFDGAIGHFADRLRDGGPFETDGHDNLETLRLAEEAYRVAGLVRP